MYMCSLLRCDKIGFVLLYLIACIDGDEDKDGMRMNVVFALTRVSYLNRDASRTLK